MKIILPLENLQYDFPVPEKFPDSGFTVYSFAKVCPKCLRVWAIAQQPETGFSIEGAWCRNCGNLIDHRILPHYARVPGSLLDSCATQRVEWALLEFLPEPLLQREFMIHLKVLA
jgi:hypothetical protein